jgi:hypothetical protein
VRLGRCELNHRPGPETLKIAAMGDKQEGTEMARAAEVANVPITTQQIKLYPRLIVTDDDSTIEECKHVKRGKQCWIKTVDESTENPNICFCMDVAPECKDYRLQALLHRMDKMLLEDEAEGGRERLSLASESLDAKIEKIERKQKLARTIFPIDPHKEKNKSSKIGRTVFYVTVGQMKHTQIVLRKKVPFSFIRAYDLVSSSNAN